MKTPASQVHAQAQSSEESLCSRQNMGTTRRWKNVKPFKAERFKGLSENLQEGRGNSERPQTRPWGAQLWKVEQNKKPAKRWRYTGQSVQKEKQEAKLAKFPVGEEAKSH